MERLVKKVRVKNDLGLHTRPATMIVQSLRNCKSSVSFTYKKETINAKSILSILMLAVQKNALLTITVEGEDAQETMERLVGVFDDHFGESHVGS
jgi:phosphocarrier protein HPr